MALGIQAMNEWSGVWIDLTTEQNLIKNSKSEGGISDDRFRNAK